MSFAELPQLHVLGAQAPALAPALQASLGPDAAELAPAPEAELLPKKKRTKVLKFFDVSTDGSGRAAE